MNIKIAVLLDVALCSVAEEHAPSFCKVSVTVNLLQSLWHVMSFHWRKPWTVSVTLSGDGKDW
jgi:hypothetical protein